MAKKTRTELSTLAINTNLPDNTTELITPTTERAQLTDERESVVNYKDDLGGVPNAGKFLTVAVDGESLTMVDEPQGDIQGSGVDGQITYWDGTKTVTSDAMLLIDTTFKTLKIVIPLANGSGGISLNAVGASASSSLVFLNNGVQMAQLYYDNPTANLVLASDGDVEISPSGTLSVDSDATFSGNVTVNSDTNAIGLRVNGRLDNISEINTYANDGTTLLGRIQTRATEMNIGSVTNIPLYLKTNSTTKLTISSGGNVGIGTSSSEYRFTVGIDAETSTLQTYTNGTGGANQGAVIRSWTYSTENYRRYTDIVAIGNWDGTNGTSAMRFFTQDTSTTPTERMRITSEGWLKASNTGTYSYAQTFHQLQTNSSNNTIAFTNTGGTPYGPFIQHTTDRNNTSEYFLIAVGGTTTRFIVYSNGNVANSNNSYGALSDVKLKENIADATPKLSDLLKVKVKNFNFIGEDTKQIGVIAQELEKIFPSMIDNVADIEDQEVTDEDGNVTTEKVDLGTTTKSVKYSVFTPMLIKAIQEQQTIIADLITRLEALEA